MTRDSESPCVNLFDELLTKKSVSGNKRPVYMCDDGVVEWRSLRVLVSIFIFRPNSI